MPGPRERMVLSTALLVRERGAQATSIADVLEHSGAPRGSAYHHFPGGRAQLLREATDLAADFVAAQIEDADTALEAIGNLVGFYRDQLIDTDHRAGCPIVAVTIESGNANTGLHQHAATAFRRWSDALAHRLAHDGAHSDQAAALALLAIASIEGALVLARAQHDPQPLDTIHLQLQALITAATTDSR